MAEISRLVFSFLIVHCTVPLSETIMLGSLEYPKNQKMLVQYLKETDALWDERVAAVMLKVDRGHYCSEAPYVDAPISIGYSVTISAPHMHAYALQKLKKQLVEGAHALDVGSGSGYLSACMAVMVGSSGKVVGVEHIPELLMKSKANVQADQPKLYRNGNLKLIEGDGRIGYPEDAPYDAIHVGAAAEEVPEALVEQLKPGGRLVVPVGPPMSQVMTIIDKQPDGSIVKSTDVSVRFVPLTDKDLQL